MWTTIDKKNLFKYFKQYKTLEKDYEDYILYEINDKILLPRYFYFNYPSNYIDLLKDKNFKEKKIDIEFQGTLKNRQLEAKNKIETIYNNKNSLTGFIKAYPGWGKTVFSAYLSTLLKLKTLIVLDNSTLIDQWIEAFVKFTNIEETDIGIFKGNEEILGKPVTITMVQTLQSRIKSSPKNTYQKIRDEGFGLVFYDEGHKTTGATKFASSSLVLNTKNIIGLSATPYGYGSGQILLDNVIGNIIYETFDYEIIPKYKFINYNTKLGKKVNYKLNAMRDFIKIQQFYNSLMYNDSNYLKLIKKITNDCLKKDHRIVIVASTIKQVNSINDYLNENGIRSIAYYGKNDELDKEKDNVMVATFKKAGTGFDYKELSVLIIACPLKGRNSIIQATGRILREKESGKNSIVFDLVDNNVSAFQNAITSKKRNLKEEYKDIEISEVNLTNL